MMKTVIIATIVLLSICFTGNAQYTQNSVSQKAYSDVQFLKGAIRVRGAEANENAIGSPYLNPDWGRATVSYSDGRTFKDVELQYNLMNNELYFRKAEEIFLFADTVKSFDLLYTVEESVRTEKFQAGYPPVDTQNEFNFYQVIAEGPKVHYLKHRFVKRNESYHYSEGKKINYFTYEGLYLFDVINKKIVKVKKGDSRVVEALPAYTESMNAIIKSQGLKIKNQEDLVRLVNLVNQQ